jgi:uncharacterized protein (TIGR03437 family)
MKPRLLIFLLALPLLAQKPGWIPTWSDEFSGSSLDSSKWVFEAGGNGWGNNESETYTSRPENLTVENGLLVIHALKENYSGTDGILKPYTSARIRTFGKFSQAYGRFEARIKIPFGQGIWPAFWMMGDDVNTADWPGCGELDIMENIGKEPTTVHGTAHGPGFSGPDSSGSSYSLPGNVRFADDFHVYSIEWEPTTVRWYVDSQLYKTLNKSDLRTGSKWVFDHNFFILLNLAVGGNWPGYPDNTTTFPQLMQVDYVRAYKAAGKPTVAAAVNGASFQNGITPGSWFTVTGDSLATNTRIWRADEIINGALPTSLDGTEVQVNGKPAYVYYISPGQINAQAPDLPAGAGTVTVIRDGQLSDSFSTTVRTYAPALFLWAGNHPAATSVDFQTVTTAKPGDVVILWGTGFGPANPTVAPGAVSPPGAVLAETPTVLMGPVTAEYLGGALAPDSAGLYQIAIRIPSAAPDGELPLHVSIGGVNSPDGVFLTVAR